METMFMIVPDLREVMDGRTACVNASVPLRFTSRTSKTALRGEGSCCKVEMREMPALLIRMSIGPRISSICRTARAGSEASVTEPWIARALGWFLCEISETTASRSERVRERQATWAPAAAKAKAVAFPMPRPAPVMRTTLPVREDLYFEGATKG